MSSWVTQGQRSFPVSSRTIADELPVTSGEFPVTSGEFLSPVNNYVISIDGQPIDRVNKMKYLGVIIDDRLTFKDHCEYIAKKMSKKVNFLRQIRNRLDIKTALLLFNSLVVPHIDFCNSILFMLNKRELHTLQLIQNRAMRIILKCSRDTSIIYMQQEIGLLSVKQRIIYNVLLFMFKATKELLPSYITTQAKCMYTTFRIVYSTQSTQKW